MFSYVVLLTAFLCGVGATSLAVVAGFYLFYRVGMITERLNHIDERATAALTRSKNAEKLAKQSTRWKIPNDDPLKDSKQPEPDPDNMHTKGGATPNAKT